MINPEGLVASITAFAVLISNTLNDDEAELLAAVLTQLGDTLATICQAKSFPSRE